ncbi:MAG TPA: GDP-mannose mannosyl hydrolase [Methylocella sp.]|nr:GDP-mannose mannosyl hydrolase [Methylocella sp.]
MILAPELAEGREDDTHRLSKWPKQAARLEERDPLSAGWRISLTTRRATPDHRRATRRLRCDVSWYIGGRMDAHPPLPKDDFAHIVRYAPLISIDLIIRDPEGKVLLGLRANEPAKDTYFVPGGIIRKNETIREAFARILKAETGLTVAFDEASFVGVFEHFYKTNRFSDPDYGTHYVVMAYELSLKAEQTIVMDSQHRDFQWMPGEKINSAANIHPNTKAYF